MPTISYSSRKVVCRTHKKRVRDGKTKRTNRVLLRFFQSRPPEQQSRLDSTKLGTTRLIDFDCFIHVLVTSLRHWSDLLLTRVNVGGCWSETELKERRPVMYGTNFNVPVFWFWDTNTKTRKHGQWRASTMHVREWHDTKGRIWFFVIGLTDSAATTVSSCCCDKGFHTPIIKLDRNRYNIISIMDHQSVPCDWPNSLWNSEGQITEARNALAITKIWNEESRTQLHKFCHNQTAPNQTIPHEVPKQTSV